MSDPEASGAPFCENSVSVDGTVVEIWGIMPKIQGKIGILPSEKASV